MIIDNAEELKDLQRWVCCKKNDLFEFANNETTNSLNNFGLQTYQEASESLSNLYEIAENNHIEDTNLPDIIAFALDNEYTAITISKPYSEDGNLKQVVKEIIEHLRSYTEI